MQREKVERAVTEGQRRAYDAEAVNVPEQETTEVRQRTAGERLSDRLAYLADRSALMRERAMDRLSPLARELTEEERAFKHGSVAEGVPLPPFFYDLEELLNTIETNLLVTLDTIEAVDV